jgi:hypothetical protein
MKNPQRNQGKVTITPLGVRRRVLAVYGSILTTSENSLQKLEFTLTTTDFVADGHYYYASCLHNLRSMVYVVSIVDNITGKDLLPYKTDRKTDLDRYKFWLTKPMVSLLVTIIG